MYASIFIEKVFRTMRATKPNIELKFKLFFISASLLLIALCTLTYAEFYMESSFEQELLGFGALALGALAAIGTITAYIGILWQRLKRFFTTERRL